jgi:hypothetical protein
MLGRQRLFKHKTWEAGGVVPPYVSPYLLEILSTRTGAPAFITATGALVANTGQTVSCARASSAYCLGDDGLLHLLGPNTVRVEPTGLLREDAASNYVYPSQAFTPGGSALWLLFQGATVTDNDAVAPDGATTACRLTMPAGSAGQDPCLYQNAIGWGSSTIRSHSIYVKKGTCRYFAMGSDAGDTGGVTLDLNTGTVVDSTGVETVGIDTLANGWFRIRAVLSASATCGETVYAFGNTTDVKDVYLGPATWSDNTGGYGWIWQAQLEEGGFCTSPIRTTTATAVRDGEAITVPNPLADLTQPVVTWRVGTWARPILDASWNLVGYPASLNIFLAGGTNGGSASFRLGIGSGYHTNGGGDVNTVGVQSVAPGWADQDTDDALNVLLTVSGGFASAVPAVDSQPVNVGQLDPFDATITLGSPVGFTSFAHQGHMRDIIADNT